MIKRELAEEIVRLTRDYCDKLNQSAQRVRDESSEDFEWYRNGVGRMMSYSYECIMGPIFNQFPDLEPEAWRGEDDDAAEAGRKIAANLDARRNDGH
jgi:hypothetical protein